MTTNDPRDPGQPKKTAPIIAAENPDIIEDYVRTFSVLHGDEFTRLEHVRGVMKEFLILGFIAETGLRPGATMLLERKEGNRTFWSYHPVTPRDNLAAAEQKMMRSHIKHLENELAYARNEITHLKAKR